MKELKCLMINPNGSGSWVKTIKPLKVTELYIEVMNETEYDLENPWGNLKLLFDMDSWDIETDGLVYEDEGFLDGVRRTLLEIGLSPEIDFSEHGMQGTNFVDFDIRKDFIETWRKMGYKDEGLFSFAKEGENIKLLEKDDDPYLIL